MSHRFHHHAAPNNQLSNYVIIWHIQPFAVGAIVFVLYVQFYFLTQAADLYKLYNPAAMFSSDFAAGLIH